MHSAWKENGVCRRGDIETLQLHFMIGFLELDDVMHNTVGCILGYMMVRGLRFSMKLVGFIVMKYARV